MGNIKQRVEWVIRDGGCADEISRSMVSMQKSDYFRLTVRATRSNIMCLHSHIKALMLSEGICGKNSSFVDTDVMSLTYILYVPFGR